MLPENRLSTEAKPSTFIEPIKRTPFADTEYGGVALGDPSQGMLAKLWACEYNKQTGEVTISAPGVAPTVLFTREGISDIALAFDQNMRPFVAFVENDVGKFYWYDPIAQANVFAEDVLGNIVTPRCQLDDKRPSQVASSDIVLAYMKGADLCFRQQRDRFGVEYILAAGVGGKLIDIGMNHKLRFQFRIANPLAGGNSGASDVSVADMVYDLCVRAGIPGEQVDVSELHALRVAGFRVMTDEGTNKVINSLREVLFFDKSEADRKISFPRRGREVAARIPYNDLIADEPSSLSRTLADGTTLPATITVTHLDPAGGFAQNKQTARRRSNLVKTKKELSFKSEVIISADQAATAAYTKLRLFWFEQGKYKFAVTLKYAHLVTTDVVEVEDREGTWHRIRIEERNDQGKTIEFEGVQDAGRDVYNTLGVGLSLPPPTSTTPGLIGPTRLEILNIPALREQDDELGVYVAVAGQGSAWFGARILISANNGAEYLEALRIETAATLGETLTDLQTEANAEYPAYQTVDVSCNFELASLSFEGLLNGGNRCVIGDEVCQFQTATLLSYVNGIYTYRLSGLLRGRYATQIEAWDAGTRFVLLDSAIYFVRAQQWMLGKELLIKPVSLGQTEDETTPTGYDFDEALSVKEWPVTMLRWERNSASNLEITWIGRARLGNDAAPQHSKYFKGYRVFISNGAVSKTFETANQFYSYSAAQQTADFGSTTFVPTIKVEAYNDIPAATGGEVEAGVLLSTATLDGWNQQTSGWSSVGGKLVYDPAAAMANEAMPDDNFSTIYRQANLPFDVAANDPTLIASVEVETDGVEAYGAIYVEFFNATGKRLGGPMGTQVVNGVSTITAKGSSPDIKFVKIGLSAFCDGVIPMKFSNVRYSIK